MRDRRRLDQFLHVKETIKRLEASRRRYRSMKFASLRALIILLGRVLEGASPERYTAMVKSVMNEHTTDEDVRWH